MIAIILFINLLSHISCQQSQSWTSYTKPPKATVLQESFLGSYNFPRILNFPNFQPYQECVPSPTFTPLTPKTNLQSTSPYSSTSKSPLTFGELSSLLKPVTSIQAPITPNLSNKMSELLSTMPKIVTSPPRVSQSFESIPYTSVSMNQLSPNVEVTQTQPQFSSLSSTFSSLTNALPSPMTSPTQPLMKPPRSIIPSPLTETIPLPYPYREPYNVFELPEPSLSSVGCLALTMTPYGTISETPLPDPSITLPRSPFLPASSPVSALAPPMSPHLPSASPAARGSHFLRKVPVPPPFI